MNITRDDLGGYLAAHYRILNTEGIPAHPIDEAVSAQSLEEFEKILSDKYRLGFKIKHGRFSHLHSGWEKPITVRSRNAL